MKSYTKMYIQLVQSQIKKKPSNRIAAF